MDEKDIIKSINCSIRLNANKYSEASQKIAYHKALDDVINMLSNNLVGTLEIKGIEGEGAIAKFVAQDTNGNLTIISALDYRKLSGELKTFFTKSEQKEIEKTMDYNLIWEELKVDKLC